MPIEPLDNDRWGFDTNCFVCEPRNERGLQIPFFCDTDRQVVVADFTLDDAYSGAPTWLHGGITLAIADEAMAWAAIALRHRFAATRQTGTTFLRPVEVGKPYRIEARITGGDDAVIAAEAVVTGASGTPRVTSQATLTVITAVDAPQIVGAEVSDHVRSYLRDGDGSP